MVSSLDAGPTISSSGALPRRDGWRRNGGPLTIAAVSRRRSGPPRDPRLERDQPLPHAIVVVPTYNEADNLPALAEAILGQKGIAHLVVVDDNSPDGTAAVAKMLADRLGRLHVVSRPRKLGLGTAYVAGFRSALALGAERIVTMDGDFSHHPAYIPRLLAASADHEVVIGSRYVPGGGIGHWGWHRRALSRGANAVAHLAAGLEARDCTSGFRCYHTDLLRRIEFDRLRSSDYAFLIEMLFVCQQLGASIAEVPIVFEERRRGASKISRTEIWRALGTVARLTAWRVHRHRMRGDAAHLARRPTS